MNNQQKSIHLLLDNQITLGSYAYNAYLDSGRGCIYSEQKIDPDLPFEGGYVLLESIPKVVDLLGLIEIINSYDPINYFITHEKFSSGYVTKINRMNDPVAKLVISMD